MDFRTKVAKNYINFRGWKTKRKIVVFESDDWGSIRMSNTESILYLKEKSAPVNNNPFTLYDTLESKIDLQLLFEVLSTVKDKNGNHASITANCVLANPDFDAIKNNNFSNYVYEHISKTYNNYYGSDDVLNFWKSDGILKNLLFPQLHGREHFNCLAWLNAVKQIDSFDNLAFQKSCLLGIDASNTQRSQNGYMAAFDYENIEELNSFKSIIKDAQNLFIKTFGFKSKSFVAPCSIRSDKMDKFLVENGVKYHQMGFQQLPKFENYKTINRFWGDTNNEKQIYWRRNSMFEPYKDENKLWLNHILNDAKVAFRWGKPLVISSHRINYVGGISSSLRDNTLNQLKIILKKLIEKYPDIEFLNSAQLGDLMYNDIFNE